MWSAVIWFSATGSLWWLMSPLDRAWKPGFSPDTSVFSALETLVIIALYKSTFTIPYRTTVIHCRWHTVQLYQVSTKYLSHNKASSYCTYAEWTSRSHVLCVEYSTHSTQQQHCQWPTENFHQLTTLIILHSFTPGLKPSLSANLSHRSLLLFFRTDSTDSRDS